MSVDFSASSFFYGATLTALVALGLWWVSIPDPIKQTEPARVVQAHGPAPPATPAPCEVAPAVLRERLFSKFSAEMLPGTDVKVDLEWGTGGWWINVRFPNADEAWPYVTNTVRPTLWLSDHERELKTAGLVGVRLHAGSTRINLGDYRR